MNKIKIRVPQEFFSWQLLNGPIQEVIERLQVISDQQSDDYGLKGVELNCVVRSNVNIGNVVYQLLEIYLTGERELSDDEQTMDVYLKRAEEQEFAEYKRLKAKYDPEPTFKELNNAS